MRPADRPYGHRPPRAETVPRCPVTTSAFDLPDHLARKADPDLVGARRAALRRRSPAASTTTVADLSDRLDARAAGARRHGQQALDRDLEVHRLTARLRALRRFGLDLCLGRIVRTDDPEPVYVGRLGLTDAARPAAAGRLALTRGRAVLRRHARHARWGWPAVAATAGRAAGSPTTGTRSSRPTALTSSAALDDQSAFVASLGADRSPRMRDVLATIQADQDAIVRADARAGARRRRRARHRQDRRRPAPLGVPAARRPPPAPGHGPGAVRRPARSPTWRTSPTSCPGLGEEGVPDLHAARPRRRGGDAQGRRPTRRSPRSRRPRRWSVRSRRPSGSTRSRRRRRSTVRTPWARPAARARRLGRGVRGAGARDAPRRGARAGVGGARHDPRRPGRRATSPRRSCGRRCSRTRSCGGPSPRAWPLLEAADVVGDLWSVPAYLRRCAPWLTRRAGPAAAAPGGAGLDAVGPARCSTRPGSGSATREAARRRRRQARRGAPRSASTAPRSSTTCSRPTTTARA